MRFTILLAVLVKSPVSWQYACSECNYLPCDTVCIPEDLNLIYVINMSDCGKMLALLPSMWSRTSGFNALFFTCLIFLFTHDKVRTVYVNNTTYAPPMSGSHVELLILFVACHRLAVIRSKMEIPVSASIRITAFLRV